MTAPIVLFLVFGACFGLATFSNRHHFSEGSTRRGNDSAGARVMWVLVCSTLWPLMALTGLLSLWRLQRVRVEAKRRR